MQRYLYMAQCRHGLEPEIFFRDAAGGVQARMKEAGAQHLSLFHWGSRLFLYYESPSTGAGPHFLFGSCEFGLEAWPGTDGPRRWIPMMDIFHYHQPASDKDWRRSDHSAKPFARIARLKPELAASYIYYHYQYQEERPGDGDKYGMIALHENLMLFYSEYPATIEPPSYKGKLSTANTPSDWMAAMTPHFVMWDEQTDNSLPWLEIPLLFQLKGDC